MSTIQDEVSEPVQLPLPIPPGLGLNELSEDEFKQLISIGGTITIGQINARLGILKVEASTLTAMGITTRRDRSSVHMASAGFSTLCDRLAVHLSNSR